MLVAVIDLGTNTFNLLIAEVDSLSGKFRKKFKDRISVKLGEGSINNGFIGEVPFERGINALKDYKLILDTHHVKKVIAFATSAIRSASNGQEFIDRALAETGIQIQAISGTREAELIYHGVRMAVELDEKPVLIMDIGGGSTEFIIADKNEIIWKGSFLLGAARLLQRFKPEEPIRPETVEAIKDHLRTELAPLQEQLNNIKIERLIGSSGAFDSFVDMLGWMFGTPMLQTGSTHFDVNLDHYTQLSRAIIKSTMDERMQMKGLIPMRRDMIVLSVIFADFVLAEYALKKLTVSTYSLKEGVIAEIIRN